MVVVIILNWNGKQLTADCLDSLFRSDYNDFSVIVVDNGSEDGSAEYLQAKYPQIDLLRSERNLGFTGGNNLAIRHVAGCYPEADYLFLLNNDTIVAPNCISALVEFAESNKAYAALTAEIYFHEPPDRLWFAGGSYNPWTGIPHHRGYKQVDTGQFDHGDCTITFANACALLVRASVLSEVGELDETLFSYAEDVDLSIRIQKQGHKLAFVPNAHVWHKVGMSLRNRAGQAKRYYYYVRNTLYVITKHTHLLQRVSAYSFFAVHTLVTLGAKSLLRGRTEEVLALWQGLSDFVRLWREKHP